VRMVLDHSVDYQSEWAAIRSIAGKFGMTAETLRTWVRQAERDKRLRPGLTTAERERLAELERQQMQEGFRESPNMRGANKVIRREGKVYIPCLGRVHIAFNPNNGQVTEAKILSTLAIEARPQKDAQGNTKLVPMEGAAPVPLSELETPQVATAFTHSRPNQGITVAAAPDPLNVQRY